MNRGMNPTDETAPSWGKPYGVALGLFALEVVLLYLFTLRFS